MEEELHRNSALWLFIILALAIFAGALMYFGRNNPDLLKADQNTVARATLSRDSRLYSVFYNSGVFSPTNIRIHVGDRVMFQNDSTQPIHIVSDVTSGPREPSLDSVIDIQSGLSFTSTFNKAGIFNYDNSNNQDEKGAVIVRP